MSAWTPPVGGTVPPANNVAAPINVGTSTASLQTGRGSLVFDFLKAKDTVIAGTEMRSPKYCDAAGINCLSADEVFEMGEVTMIHNDSTNLSQAAVTFNKNFTVAPQVIVSIADAEFANGCTNDAGTFRVYAKNVTNEGFTVEGPYDNSGGCGSSRVSKATWIASSGGSAVERITLRDTEGSTENIVLDFLYSRYPGTRLITASEGVYAGEAERNAMCQLLLLGSIVEYYDTSSYDSPRDNALMILVGSIWTYQYNVSSYNSRLTSITCVKY